MPYGDEKSYAFFKMKGSPMQRNFGTSPMKDTDEVKKAAKDYENMWKSTDTYKRLTEAGAPDDVIQKAKDSWSTGEKKSLN